MKSAIILAALAATGAVARPHVQQEDKFRIELAPGQTQWVTEAEKWALRKQGKHFIDITNHPDLPAASRVQRAKVAYPAAVAHQAQIKPQLANLDKAKMQTNLEKMASYNNRYYKSDTGKQSGDWLFGTVKAVGGTVSQFKHAWGQQSVIASIPGKSNRTVVVGAHQDSINLNSPMSGKAPGADDDGSGSVTILEAMRVYLSMAEVQQGQAENTVEFHWYSAEEGGLLGSQDIFQSYKKAGRDVVAMLQQDMTGYTKGTTDAGKKESVAVYTDYVDPDLTTFVKKVVTAYCDIPFVESKCGYGCSDHASANKAGYPSSLVAEAEFDLMLPEGQIHSPYDTLDKVNYDHMLQHAKMTFSFAYELGFNNFDGTQPTPSPTPSARSVQRAAEPRWI